MSLPPDTYVASLRASHAEGRVAVVSFVNVPSPAVVELVCHLGADLVILDGEHGPMGFETLEQMVRAAQSAATPTLVRLPYADPRLVNRSLDTGASGVLVPHIDSVEVAEAVVRAAKFAPEGNRGAGAVSRAGRFGVWSPDTPYAAWANDNTLVFGILEDPHVAVVLDEVVAVEGFDGFSLGHSDLSHALGLAGQVHHPEVETILDRMTDAVLNLDKMLIRVARGDEQQAMADVAAYRARGVGIIGVPFTSPFRWGNDRLAAALERD